MKTETSVAIAVEEKRRERRYPTNDPVEVRVFPSITTPIPATIVDVSRSGMKLELVTPLAAGGTRIEVTMPASRATVLGTVRYCRRVGTVYHVGVLIENVVQPKPDRIHLHDDEISLYIVGKGLTSSEVLWVETHVFRCDECHGRMLETARMLYPRGRVR